MNEVTNPEPASQNSLNVDLGVLPFPPFPSPIQSMVSPAKHHQQQFYSTVDVPADAKRKRRRAKREWKSTGENSSKSSSDCSPEKELSVKTDRGQEMRKSAKFALQKNCTYESGSDKSKSMKTTKGRRYVSEKLSSVKKTTLNVKKPHVLYKSTSQITTWSPLSNNNSHKASSAMELDLLTRKQFRSTPYSPQTVEVSSRWKEECMSREFICPGADNIEEDDISRDFFINGELIEMGEIQTSGHESPSSYYTGTDNEPMKNVLCHPLLPSLSSSLKKINKCDKYRSGEDLNSHIDKQSGNDIFQTPLKSKDGEVQANRIRITVEISPEPSA